MGILDVDGMLAAMDPRQLDEWIASYKLDPFDDDWQRTAVLASEIRNLRQYMVAQMSAMAGHKSDLNLSTPLDFLPGDAGKQAKRAVKQQRHTLTAKQSEARAKQRWG